MIVLVMQGITAKCRPNMIWEFIWDNSAGECLHPADHCYIMPTQAVSDKSKVQVAFEEAEGAQSLVKNIVLRLFDEQIAEW